MFEKLRYRLNSRQYFNPVEQNSVSYSDFFKILKGEVLNPRRLEYLGFKCDHSFMVVGVDEKSPP